jgi:hypothetical protein
VSFFDSFVVISMRLLGRALYLLLQLFVAGNKVEIALQKILTKI